MNRNRSVQEAPKLHVQAQQDAEIIPKTMKVHDFRHPVMRWSMYDTTLSNMLHKSMSGQPSDVFETKEFRELSTLVHNLQPIDLEVRFLESQTNGNEMNGGEPLVPPGVYDFRFKSEREDARFHGIVVDRDGRFEPHMSAHAIYLAQAQRFGTQKFDHVYIEAIRWDQGNTCFQVSIGS